MVGISELSDRTAIAELGEGKTDPLSESLATY